MVRAGFAHILRWRSILKLSFRPSPRCVVVIIAAACSCASAQAAVFKCQGEGGVPIYQEFPCAPGRELRNFATDPPPLTIIPGETAKDGTAARAQSERTAPARSSAAKAERSGKKARGDAAERRHAHTGMTEAEVLAKLGRPDVTAVGARKGRGRWSYLPAPGDPDTITTLQFDRGVVVDVERKVLKR